ncbi:MAG: hypothetical protein ACR9NN_07520 [Nostochopsis sp.]
MANLFCIASFVILVLRTEQPTTNNQQPTTNNQQPTTNNQQPTTNNQQPTTNNQQLIMPSRLLEYDAL